MEEAGDYNAFEKCNAWYLFSNSAHVVGKSL